MHLCTETERQGARYYILLLLFLLLQARNVTIDKRVVFVILACFGHGILCFWVYRKIAIGGDISCCYPLNWVRGCMESAGCSFRKATRKSTEDATTAAVKKTTKFLL